MSVYATRPPVQLLTVEEALLITGRGLLLTPGLREAPAVPIKLGDRIKLESPAGDHLESVIKGLEAIHNRNVSAPEIHYFVVLPASLPKESVPRGTKVVWLGASDESRSDKQ